MPSAAASDSNLSRSAFSWALLVPSEAGALLSSTNHFVLVSLAAPPTRSLRAKAGVTARHARHASAMVSRRLLSSIAPFPQCCQRSDRLDAPETPLGALIVGRSSDLRNPPSGQPLAPEQHPAIT